MSKKMSPPTAVGADESVSRTALVSVKRGPKSEVAKSKAVADAGVYKEKGVTLIVDQPYVLGNRSIVADAVFFVDGRKSREKGPWLGEADKIAWRDEASGYEAIIMRTPGGGYLGGYVGVPPTHPLYGFEHAAIPCDFQIEIHGGLTYSKACEHGPTPDPRLAYEARRICHVPRSGQRVRMAPPTHASDYRVQDDDAWWFGFECNHIYDHVPGNPRSSARFLGAETGAVYRDEAYVYDEVVQLAAQLRAIADGLPKPLRTGPPLPPLGLDPRLGG